MKHAVPLAILLGSIVIAAGLFFGLRPQPTPVAPTSAPPPIPSASPTAPPPTPQRTDPQVQSDVVAAITSARPAWIAACWDTADPAQRKAGRYIAATAFDASGKLVVWGISELRNESDPAIAQCLRRYVNTLRIPAPGHPVSVEVPFALP